MKLKAKSTLEKVLYLACDDRSGSTVTERCLAATPEVWALGEVHNLSAYIRDDRSFFDPPYDLVCTCGSRVANCEFWLAVAVSMRQSLDALKLRVDFPRRHGLPDLVDRARWRAEEWAKEQRGFGQRGLLWHYLRGYNELSENYWHLYEAAAEVSGRSIVVDSSKWPLRFNYLAKNDDGRLHLLLMYRSPWAVVHSKIRQTAVSPERALARWFNYANQMERFAAQIPEARVFRLFYEEFCESPQTMLGDVLSALGASTGSTFELAPLTGIHQVGGSPSKFDKARTAIEVDDSYKETISAELQQMVEHVAGSYWRDLVSKFAQRPAYVLERTRL